MTYKLRFTNPWGERFFFATLGNFWPGNVTRRLIERTVRSADDARVFVSADEAREVLATAGRPAGWEVLDEGGIVVE